MGGEEPAPAGEQHAPRTAGGHVPPEDEDETTEPGDRPAPTRAAVRLPQTGADMPATLASLGLGLLLAGAAVRSRSLVRRP